MIRAYKLAEELGMDRQEFVERAAAAGVELRSAMASVDEDIAEKLRKKFGSAKKPKNVTEKRVEGRSGSIIRRRKKVEEASPEPVAVPEPIAAEAEPAPSPEAAVEPAVAEEDAPAASVPAEAAIAPEPAAVCGRGFIRRGR